MANYLATLPFICEGCEPENYVTFFKYLWEKGFYYQEYCHGAISEGCQVKALNWLLRVVTIKTLDKEEKERK